MYDGREQAYGAGAGRSGNTAQAAGRGYGTGTLNGQNGKDSSDGALARFASASTSALASAPNPTAVGSIDNQASTTQATPRLGNSAITTLPSFLAHYGGLSSRSHTESPTISNQIPSQSPTMPPRPSPRQTTSEDTQDRLAKLHSSFGPLASSPETSNNGGRTSSMGMQYFGSSADSTSAVGGLAGTRHSSDGAIGTQSRHDAASGTAVKTNEPKPSPSQSPMDTTQRQAVPAEAPATLHALLYGATAPTTAASSAAAGQDRSEVRTDVTDPVSAAGGTFVGNGANGVGNGGGSKEW